MKIGFCTAAFALGMVCSSTASARDHRVTQLPYGATFGCTSCHVSATGGGVFTGFGSDTILALVGGDLLQERDLDWSQVYQLDSDRDGFTNGEEVYDPMGVWRIGDRNPVGGVPFNPGNANSHPFASCGDGRVTPPEECDGANFGTQSCIGLGLDEGVLKCNPDCSFDRSGCGGSPPVDVPNDPPSDMNTTSGDAESACSTGGTVAGRLWPLAATIFTFAFGRQRRRHRKTARVKGQAEHH